MDIGDILFNKYYLRKYKKHYTDMEKIIELGISEIFAISKPLNYSNSLHNVVECFKYYNTKTEAVKDMLGEDG